MAPSITIIIDGKTFVLRAKDTQVMRDMSAEDRSQLIALLEILKEQHEQSAQLVNKSVARHTSAGSLTGTATRMTSTHAADTLATSSLNANKIDTKIPTKERMGKGDVDQIFSRLVMEEKKQQKPGPTSATVYKVVAVVVVAIIILASLF